MQPYTHLFEDETVHFSNKMILFEHRNKEPRGEQAIARNRPSHQRLRASHGTILHAHLGLHIDDELLIIQTFLHAVLHLHLRDQLLPDLIAVERIVLSRFVLDFLLGEIGPVDHHHRLRLLNQILHAADSACNGHHVAVRHDKGRI